MDDMSIVVLTGLVIKLVTAFLALFVGWLFLRMLDWISGINFKLKLDELHDNGFALYSGLRFVGVCILLAYILG